MGLHGTMNNSVQSKQTDELRITQLLAINSEQAEQIKKLRISLNELQKEKNENDSLLNKTKSDLTNLKKLGDDLRAKLEDYKDAKEAIEAEKDQIQSDFAKVYREKRVYKVNLNWL